MCLSRRSNPFGESGDSPEDSEGAVNSYLLISAGFQVLYVICGVFRKKKAILSGFIFVRA